MIPNKCKVGSQQRQDASFYSTGCKIGTSVTPPSWKSSEHGLVSKTQIVVMGHPTVESLHWQTCGLIDIRWKCLSVDLPPAFPTCTVLLPDSSFAMMDTDTHSCQKSRSYIIKHFEQESADWRTDATTRIISPASWSIEITGGGGQDLFLGGGSI